MRCSSRQDSVLCVTAKYSSSKIQELFYRCCSTAIRLALQPPKPSTSIMRVTSTGDPYALASSLLLLAWNNPPFIVCYFGNVHLYPHPPVLGVSLAGPGASYPPGPLFPAQAPTLVSPSLLISHASLKCFTSTPHNLRDSATRTVVHFSVTSRPPNTEFVSPYRSWILPLSLQVLFPWPASASMRSNLFV